MNSWWFWLGAAGRFVLGDAVHRVAKGKSSIRACLAACGKVRRILAWGFAAVRAARGGCYSVFLRRAGAEERITSVEEERLPKLLCELVCGKDLV